MELLELFKEENKMKPTMSLQRKVTIKKKVIEMELFRSAYGGDWTTTQTARKNLDSSEV